MLLSIYCCFTALLYGTADLKCVEKEVLYTEPQ